MVIDRDTESTRSSILHNRMTEQKMAGVQSHQQTCLLNESVSQKRQQFNKDASEDYQKGQNKYLRKQQSPLKKYIVYLKTF